MDERTPLKGGSELRFRNREGGAVRYTVGRELGRGGSCIVYSGTYGTNAGVAKTVRIKECYPWRLDIGRLASGALSVPDAAERMFRAALARFWGDFRAGNGLFYAEGLSDSLVNTLDIYEANNTAYIVSVYAPEDTLAAWQPETMRACVSAAGHIARILAGIHRAGYLYLDLKPDNVLMVREPVERALLFDFDSLVPLAALEGRSSPGDIRLSCAPGFAPLELRLAQRRRLGPWSDVYTVGALLFWLLFGRPPAAPDCGPDARYDFEAARCSGTHCQDKLFPALEDFFRRTLSDYLPDRYPDMEQAVLALEGIGRLADTERPFVRGTPVVPPRLLVGRERELAALAGWFEAGRGNCLFVAGMGGIGKSTLVRGFLAANSRAFDTVLWLNWSGSVEDTFADDRQLFLNTVERREEETTAQYFGRKLRQLRRLLTGERAVLVLDNYEGTVGPDLLCVLCEDWKTVVIGRRCPPDTAYDVLYVDALETAKARRALFEAYLGRKLREDELDGADRIAACAAGHTLALELTARQIAGSRLTVPEAAALAERRGIAGLAPEKVDFVKDQTERYAAASSIIDALFDAGRLSAEKRTVLKLLSLFGAGGIGLDVFQALLALPTRDGILELVREGWSRMDGEILSLHPVVGEAVRRWEWSGPGREAARLAMEDLLQKLRLEHREEEFPPAGSERLRDLLRLCEALLDGCGEDGPLASCGVYRDLLYRTAMALPRYREEDILRRAARLLGDAGFSDMLRKLNLYDRIAAVHEARGDLERAREVLEEARRTLPAFPRSDAWGRYYDMLAGWYDAALDGFYEPRNREEARLLARLLDALSRAIRCLERSRLPGGRKLLAQCLMSKAAVLTRSAPRKARTIDGLLTASWELLEQYTGPDAEMRLGWHMCRAWYHTLAAPDFEEACASMELARAVSAKSSPSELDEIDAVVIPAANILLTWKRYGQAAERLEEGVSVCEKYGDVVPYVRKKMDLLSYLLGTFYEAGDLSRCREILARIDRENIVNAPLGVFKEISPELRERIAGA